MSQKPTKFQSKPRAGKQKFGGDRKFGDKPGFGKRKSFGDGEKRFSKRNEGDKPFKKRRFEGEREEGFRPRKEFGDRPRRERSFDGDKPFRKSRSEGEGERSFRPRKEFGDRPRKSFGDKPFRKSRSEGEGERSFRPRKEFGDRPRKSFGDKPFKKRSFDGDREEGFRPRKDFGDRPRKSFGDNKFGDKKPFRKKFGDDKFGDKPFKKKFDNRPQKPFKRYEEDAPRKEFRGERLKSDRPSYGAPSSAFLYGIHPVTQALLNPKRVHQRLLATERGFESLAEAWREAEQDGLTLPEVVTVEREDIERLLPRDAVHQDVLLDAQPLEDAFLSDVLNDAGENALLLVLDQVTDPHNVGAILRSAAAFGARGVIVQKLHAPDITGTLAKSASGAVEIVPLVREVNLSRTLEVLKEAGFTCIGLAERGQDTLAGMKLSGKVALVLGAEGSGLRRLVAENCDALVKLPTQEPIASLNVSNAAAVALYELVRARA